MPVSQNGRGRSRQCARDERPEEPPRSVGSDARRTARTSYRQLFDRAPDGIIVVDAQNGRILDANPFMTRLVGLTREEILGRELSEIGLRREVERGDVVSDHPGDRDALPGEDIVLWKAPEPDGVQVQVVSSGSYQQCGQQVILYHIRDITEQKRTEQRAARHAEELVLAARRKDEFLAVLSHELRNALAPVANALQILRLAQEADGSHSTRARSLIERQVRNMSHLVDDLTDVARISAGQIHLQSDRVDLRQAVERSVEAMRLATDHRNHNVSVTMPGHPVWLDADAARLEQVVVNLLSNAAKYTQDGGSIDITVRDEQDRAELRVVDSGIGIAPEMLSRVFDLFARAEHARERSAAGLGIGLNVVKRIVDLHGGSVIARSAGPSAGSEFVVSLPLASSAA